MQKFIIERNVPGAGDLSPDELRTIAQKSNDVVATLRPSTAPSTEMAGVSTPSP